MVFSHGDCLPQRSADHRRGRRRGPRVHLHHGQVRRADHGLGRATPAGIRRPRAAGADVRADALPPRPSAAPRRRISHESRRIRASRASRPAAHASPAAPGTRSTFIRSPTGPSGATGWCTASTTASTAHQAAVRGGSCIMTEPLASSGSELPPLRIHHILVATAVTAVFMSIAQTLRRDDIGGVYSFIASGLGVIYAVCGSVALTAVGFGLIWRQKGIAFFHQPGHWLLVTLALGGWVGGLITFFLNRPPASGNTVGGLFLVCFYGLRLAMIGVDFWAAWRVGDTPWWRFLFVLQGSMIITRFALPLLSPSSILFAYVSSGIQLLRLFC